MERSVQFSDGECVDSSTGTAERLDAVKRGRSRCRRAETTAARRAAKLLPVYILIVSITLGNYHVEPQSHCDSSLVKVSK